MNTKTFLSMLGLALTITGVTGSAANALFYEAGVENSWNNRNGRYYERQNLKIDAYDQYKYDVKTNTENYSVKVDITAPGPAVLRFSYKNKTKVPGAGKLKVSGFGSNTPVNPDPTLMLVEQSSTIQAHEQGSGHSTTKGDVLLINQGTENGGFMRANGFFGTR